MQLIVHPAARRELDAALQWSRTTFGSPTAVRLRQRFDRIGQLLLREPGLGTPAARQTRKLRLGKFPYTLVYRVTGEVITVLAVAHQSREPGYWLGR